MKNSFFALILLMPAFASAAVKVELNAHCGEDALQETVQLANIGDSYEMKHESGVKATITLDAETADHADFTVAISKDGEEGVCDLKTAKVSAVYGEKAELKCNCDSVDAELSMVVTALNEEAAE